MSHPDDARLVLPAGAAVPARIPAGIFAAAADTFVAGQRLDMRSLARRLGVARATLYRRAGNREQLLDELLWWRARRLLVDQVQASAGLAGTERSVHGGGGRERVQMWRGPRGALPPLYTCVYHMLPPFS